jgi:hypothetical protein
MGNVFTSEGTGAVIYVFSDDHCPPHIHARHRGEGWIARASWVPGAKQITDAEYDTQKERLRVCFCDGTIEEVRLGP